MTGKSKSFFTTPLFLTILVLDKIPQLLKIKTINHKIIRLKF
jgi:chromosome segregation and condensation protein ScpB